MKPKKKGKSVTYIDLLSLNYHQQEPKKLEEYQEKSGLTRVFYKTNNPDIFWAKPNQNEK